MQIDDLRAHDWSAAGLGAYETWPQTLRGYVSMILEMPSPAIIFWGPDQTQIYNDGYAVIMGPRHPRYFGAPYRECWPDTYPIIHPWMCRVLEQGDVVEVTRHLFVLTRHGFTEECYFTFTFSPLRDDTGAIAGIFQPVFEVTDAVLGDRRAETLRALASREHAPSAVSDAVTSALSANALDIPFALVYLQEEGTGELALAAHTGLEVPPSLGSALAIARRAHGGGPPELTEEVEALLGGPHIGHWPEPTGSAYVVPVRRSVAEPPLGAAILGVSPRLPFDQRYREFFDSVAGELAVGIAAARARAAESALLEREQVARREAELQKEHLAAVVNQAPTPMVLLRGRDHVVELANPPACELWRRRPEEVHGRPLFDALPELREQVFQRLLREVFETGEAWVGRETHARVGKEGDVADVYLNFVYAPVRAAGGEVDGVLVLAFDVTEQVRARGQIDELRAAAETASRAKDQFLAILGHELRNPLAPILTAVQLMGSRGDEQVERERRIIERQARHLVRLVDDMLDVSRVLTGKVALEKEPTELAEVIAAAVERTRPLIEERAHSLLVDVPSVGLVVEADPERLSQVFGNLLSNAAKYTERGGTIAIAATCVAGVVEAIVTDSGIGISHETLPRIFDMFTQERQALDRSRGGLGLGLTIVQSLVHQHGGAIEARSAGPGRGSEFVVRLPAVAGPAGLVEAGGTTALERADSRAKTPARRLLVVDDNEDAAELLAAALDSMGYEVRIAHDGLAALRLVDAYSPDIALLDIGLPGMNGYDLARHLREHAELGHLRLVALTGYGQDSDRRLSLESGFDAHLVKPTDLDRLRSLIEELAP